MVSARLTRQSAEVILTALMAEEGIGGIDVSKSAFVERALARTPGLVRFSLRPDRPLVALGASAPVHYPAIADMLDIESFVPVHAGVANAVGAVVGQVRETVTVFVTEPDEGALPSTGPARTSSSGSAPRLSRAHGNWPAPRPVRPRSAAAPTIRWSNTASISTCRKSRVSKSLSKPVSLPRLPAGPA
jgi:N-methylhydantoinase A/oxoprolinase/acetone carboxylase beta subunit